ncbi:MAG: 4Fe-4S ferredoxin [Bacteroidetes bacterium]|nr:MAG: 4Fe-4S ferredoxin [Bacteroidota bacterium]
MELHDFIVVGSGCTGAMAAQTLVESGARVLMLDGGKRGGVYQSITPSKNFPAIRREEQDQHRYLLGDKFESIPAGKVSTGEQLTPARRFMIEAADHFLRHRSDTFFPMESLGYGGLGAGWGLGCCVFSENELKKAGLPVAEMQSAYQLVSDRIGISGSSDDAQAFTFAHLEGIQPAPRLHPTAEKIYSRYAAKKTALKKNGFHLGRPALALLTQEKDHRKPLDYRDMEFYDDKGLSAWRAWITVDELQKKNNFMYRGSTLVTAFHEENGSVRVESLNLDTQEKETFHCRKLVLSPGVLSTARIVLRSMDENNHRLPLLCNPYNYTPCLVLSETGKSLPDALTGMAQLSLFHDADGTQTDVAMASLYNYRSLLMFRLLKEVPLGFRDARMLMNYLLPGIVIMGIHHPESAGGEKFLHLEADSSSPTGDLLRTVYKLNETESAKITAREKLYAKAMRKLGAWALKRVSPGHGSSIHYAGTLPFDDNGKPFSIHPSGRLNGTENVFIADGSGFRFLPAKGLTLSLMANAHLVAEKLLKK